MSALDAKLKEELETANKLVFVKQYKKAAMLLDDVLAKKDHTNCLLLHLRRIEIGARLGETQALHTHYLEEMRLSHLDLEIGRICIAMVEQHGQMIAPSASIQNYSEIMQDHGESAAAYFGIGLSLEGESNNERALYNYLQSINKDAGWYPAYFGLSQIYYQMHETNKGDHYFYLFEQAAPYNLYGNIETHRQLSQEFLEKNQFHNAENAIKSLSEWWIENRGQCPAEILVLESLSLAHIAEKKGDSHTAALDLIKFKTLVTQILEAKDSRKDDLHFLAQVLQDFSQNQLALKVYKKMLIFVDQDPSLIQSIGTHFLSMGALNDAQDLFQDAYTLHPDHPDVRFCLLASRLKLAKVDTESYFRRREIAAKRVADHQDSAETKTLLLALIEDYPNDPDVQGLLGELSLELGDTVLARRYFQKMYRLDEASLESSFRYASFLINFDNRNEGNQILDKILFRCQDDEDKKIEIQALRSRFFEQKGDFKNALALATLSLDHDPWSIEYLNQAIRCHMQILSPQERLVEIGTSGVDLAQVSHQDWLQFDQKTQALIDAHHYSLVYLRQQLRLLTTSGNPQQYGKYIEAAIQYNSTKGAHDLLKLLNTNFDSPWLYWALGVLFKESGALEVAEMWLEQLISKASLPESLRLRVNLDLSDSYVWRGIHLQKALAYLKLVRDTESEHAESAKLIMAHALLKLGEVRAARDCLSELKGAGRSLESAYLQGLLLYRDGSVQKAKAVWKPLLTTKTYSIKDHWIKKEILEFYFQGKSYIQSE